MVEFATLSNVVKARRGSSRRSHQPHPRRTKFATLVLLAIMLVFVPTLAVAAAAASGAEAPPVAGGRMFQRAAGDLPSARLRGTVVGGDTSASPQAVDCVLQSLKVNAFADGPLVTMNFTHVFRNSDPTRRVEAQFLFPVMSDMAVSGLLVRTPRGVTRGVIKGKAQARAEYQAAVDRGHSAVLSEYDADLADMVSMKVGNLFPDEEMEITTQVVWRLHAGTSPGEWLFELPLAYIVPYNNRADGATADTPAVASQPQTNRVPYTWEVRVVARGLNAADGAITAESLTFPADVHTDRATAETTIVMPKAATTQSSSADEVPPQPNRMVQLRFTTNPGDEANAVSKVQQPLQAVLSHPMQTTDDGTAPGSSRALLVTGDLAQLLVVDDGTGKERRGDTVIPGERLEYIFVLDRSGSMSGDSIVVARRALQEALRSLPAGSTFNVVSFGSSFKAMLDAPVAATSASIEEAVHKVASFDSDMGGTEINAPMQSVLRRAPRYGRFRNVFLMTDGQVWDKEAVIETITAAQAHSRVFTFGIGSGVSPFIITEGARAGRGTSTFVSDGSNSYLPEAVADAMAAAGSYSFVLARAHLETSTGRQVPIVTRASAVPSQHGAGGQVIALGAGGASSVSLLALVETEESQEVACAPGTTLVARVVQVPAAHGALAAERSTNVLRLVITSKQPHSSTPDDECGVLPHTVVPLAAKDIFQALEHENFEFGLNDAIVQLSSVKYQVVSKRTAIVAVQERPSDGDARSDDLPLHQERVPSSHADGSPPPHVPGYSAPATMAATASMSISMQPEMTDDDFDDYELAQTASSSLGGKVVLVDVVPLSIGFVLTDGTMLRVILRNTAIPVSKAVVAHIPPPRNGSLCDFERQPPTLQIVEGDHLDARRNFGIANVTLDSLFAGACDDLNSTSSRGLPVAVHMEVDENSALHARICLAVNGLPSASSCVAAGPIETSHLSEEKIEDNVRSAAVAAQDAEDKARARQLTLGDLRCLHEFASQLVALFDRVGMWGDHREAVVEASQKVERLITAQQTAPAVNDDAIISDRVATLVSVLRGVVDSHLNGILSESVIHELLNTSASSNSPESPWLPNICQRGSDSETLTASVARRRAQEAAGSPSPSGAQMIDHGKLLIAAARGETANEEDALQLHGELQALQLLAGYPQLEELADAVLAAHAARHHVRV